MILCYVMYAPIWFTTRQRRSQVHHTINTVSSLSSPPPKSVLRTKSRRRFDLYYMTIHICIPEEQNKCVIVKKKKGSRVCNVYMII